VANVGDSLRRLSSVHRIYNSVVQTDPRDALRHPHRVVHKQKTMTMRDLYSSLAEIKAERQLFTCEHVRVLGLVECAFQLVQLVRRERRPTSTNLQSSERQSTGHSAAWPGEGPGPSCPCGRVPKNGLRAQNWSDKIDKQ